MSGTVINNYVTVFRLVDNTIRVQWRQQAAELPAAMCQLAWPLRFDMTYTIATHSSSILISVVDEYGIWNVARVATKSHADGITTPGRQKSGQRPISSETFQAKRHARPNPGQPSPLRNTRTLM